jgi:hypothetical protein
MRRGVVDRRARLIRSGAPALAAALLAAGAGYAHGAVQLRPELLNGVFGDYSRVAEAAASPAPLVPTELPAVRADEVLLISPGVEPRSRHGRYGIRLVWRQRASPFRIRATLVVERGRFRTLALLRREYRRLGFSAPKLVRVRGRQGLVFRRAPLTSEVAIVWVEDGRVHELSTGTPRRIPLSALRRLATGLDAIGPLLVGSTDQTLEHVTSAVGFTTPRTISLSLEFSGPCVDSAGAPVRGGLGGSAVALLAPVAGSTYSRSVQSLPGSSGFPPWTVNVSATIAPSSVAVDLRASVSVPPGGFFTNGATCDTGTQSLTLTPARALP